MLLNSVLFNFFLQDVSVPKALLAVKLPNGGRFVRGGSLSGGGARVNTLAFVCFSWTSWWIRAAVTSPWPPLHTRSSRTTSTQRCKWATARHASVYSSRRSSCDSSLALRPSLSGNEFQNLCCVMISHVRMKYLFVVLGDFCLWFFRFQWL